MSEEVLVEDVSEDSYDQVLYPSKPFPYTSMSMMAAQARVWGLDPVPIQKARVLELGCSFGGNIITQALYYPEATFTGIDLSEKQIEQGQEIIEDMGIPNIRLEHKNIMDIDESFGQFDYIVVHGIWSWVPPMVQDKILSVCHENLSDRGIAYVSFNTYPGWKRLEQIREMMIHRTGHIDDLMERTAAGKAFLKSMHECISGIPREVEKRGNFVENLAEVVQKSDYYVGHEYLEDINIPVYIHEFIRRAEEQGCVYIGDSNFQLSFVNWIPQAQRDLIVSLAGDNRVEREQILDYTYDVQFRRALLTSPANAPKVTRNETVSLDVLRSLHFTRVDAEDLFNDNTPPLHAAIQHLASTQTTFTMADVLQYMTQQTPAAVGEADELAAANVLFMLLCSNRLYIYADTASSEPYEDGVSYVPERFRRYVKALLNGANQYIWGSNPQNVIDSRYNDDVLWVMESLATPTEKAKLVREFHNYQEHKGVTASIESCTEYIDKVLTAFEALGYLAK